MNRAALRRATRRHSAAKRFLAVTFGISGVLVAGVTITLLMQSMPPGPSPTQVAALGGESFSTTEPLDLKRATPMLTPTESATPTPEPAVVLQSLPATLTIPAAGIYEMPISQIDPQRDLQWYTSGSEKPYLTVTPPTMEAIVWDNDASSRSTLTSQSPVTAPLYCHANTEEDPGVCQYLKDVRKGDELVIETPTERLTYRATMNPKVVPKQNAEYDPTFTADIPNTIEVITCNRDGKIDDLGHSFENRYVFFALMNTEVLGD